MEEGKAKCMSPLDVAANAVQLAEGLGMGRVDAHMERRKLIQWLRDVQEALAPLFKRNADAKKAA
jgi:hypothetical protein